MTESQLLTFLAIFAGGVLVGVLATLFFNKIRGGKVSAGAIKRDFDDYQTKVEEHFDETSEKFKAMAEQYKDLYQHLSVGATSLCRPDHVVAGLSDQSDPLQPLPKPTDKPAAKKSAATAQDKSAQKPQNQDQKRPAGKGQVDSAKPNPNKAVKPNAANDGSTAPGKEKSKSVENSVKPASQSSSKEDLHKKTWKVDLI